MASNARTVVQGMSEKYFCGIPENVYSCFSMYTELILLGSFKITRNLFTSGKYKTLFQLYYPQNSPVVNTSNDCNVIRNITGRPFMKAFSAPSSHS